MSLNPKEAAILVLAASKEFELGRFFFTVITATVGFLLTAEKMNTTPEWKGLLLVGLGILVLAMIVAVYMTLVSPAETMSTNRFTKLLARLDFRAWGCFWLWVLGTAIGCFAVLPNPG